MMDENRQQCTYLEKRFVVGGVWDRRICISTHVLDTMEELSRKKSNM